MEGASTTSGFPSEAVSSRIREEMEPYPAQWRNRERERDWKQKRVGCKRWVSKSNRNPKQQEEETPRNRNIFGSAE